MSLAGTRRLTTIKREAEKPTVTSRVQEFTKLTEPRDFTFELQYYNIKDETKQYRRRAGHLKKVLHWGQRKLILQTIQFFTLYWDPQKIQRPNCLYIGAAPGYSIVVMNKLFPDLNWTLYDKVELHPDVKASNVKIVKEYFTNEEASEWINKVDFLISDIRSREYNVSTADDYRWELEKIIIKDMIAQENWVFIINPTYASLKFRLPYVENYYKKGHVEFPYLQGAVFYQPWIGSGSAETRLVPIRDKNGRYYQVLWDCKRHEDILYYHNLMHRETYRYKNPFSTDGSTIDGNELIDDWDSMMEAQILAQYLMKIKQPVNQLNIAKLSRFITKTINELSSSKIYWTLERKREALTDAAKVHSMIEGNQAIKTVESIKPTKSEQDDKRKRVKSEDLVIVE